MKKLLVILMCLLIAVSMAFVMTGCGEEEKKEDVKTSAVSKDKDKNKDKDKKDEADEEDSADEDEEDEEDEDEEDEDEEDKKTTSSKNSIVGKWVLECDYTHIIDTEFLLDEEEIKNMGLDKLTYDRIFEFTDDGKFIEYYDEDGLSDWVDNFKKRYIDYYTDVYYTDVFDNEEAAEEKYFESVESAMNSVLELADGKSETKYKTKGNTLIIFLDIDDVELEYEYKFKIENNTLTIDQFLYGETVTLQRK